MTKLFDRIIVSSDDSPTFLNFWPCVAKAWQKFFSVKPTLALLSTKNENDALVNKLKTFGDVVIVTPIENVPIPNQAKLARFIVASKMNDEVCMIEDMDTVPLQSKFVVEKLSVRNPNKILAVGHEVYEKDHPGKFPVSNITAKGNDFKKLFNPYGLNDKSLLESFVGLKMLDDKENIANQPSQFSDESLIRGLIHKQNLHHMIQKVERGVDIHRDWIDRSWWGIDKDKLNSGGYILCNFLRPCRENAQHFIPIYEYLYGYLPKASELFIL
ncbi:MAG TPA: hypothetical protein DEF82_04785 [Crocinitomicaceae bacterium]|nr:hypothetical protein [Crocinitomicaceae bacterium]